MNPIPSATLLAVLEAVDPLEGLVTADPLEALTAVGSLAALVAVDPDPAHVVGTGGAIGAVLRYWVGQRISSRFGAGRFPLATFAVNVVGSFALGLVVFAGAGESTLRLVGTGICGSFTTFSSFSVETVRLYERDDRAVAVGTAAANLAGSLAAIGLAWGLVAGLSP